MILESKFPVIARSLLCRTDVHIVGNVSLLAILRFVVEIVRGNRSKVRGGSLSRSLILHSNR
jgi:hypothetical protein